MLRVYEVAEAGGMSQVRPFGCLFATPPDKLGKNSKCPICVVAEASDKLDEIES
jgi:hypothetical protein